MESENKKWNPKDWQGRRKHQIETGYKIMGFTFMLVVAAFVLYGLFSLVTYVLV